MVSVSTKEAASTPRKTDIFSSVIVEATLLTVLDGFLADGTRGAVCSHRILRATRQGRNIALGLGLIAFLSSTWVLNFSITVKEKKTVVDGEKAAAQQSETPNPKRR
jgi:hypothetical protein